MYADRLFNALERNEPGPGQLLVAAPGMESPEFARSVVLVIEHSAEATFGVILNRRSDMAVFNVFPEWVPLISKPQALYIGGPVNHQAVIGVGMTKPGVVIEDEPRLRRLAPRLAYVDLRAEPAELSEIISGLRLFAGYADWGPGELDEEIAEGHWYVAPALPNDVLVPAAVDLWANVMKRQPMPLPLYSTFPADATAN